MYSMQVKWSEPDGMFVATCPEFGGISALGESYEDAVRELQVAINLAIATYRENGRALPEPRTPETHSGQFRLRLPRSLHAALANRAEDEGVSLNTLVISILSESQGFVIGSDSAKAG
jgi:antitoxin HicB